MREKDELDHDIEPTPNKTDMSKNIVHTAYDELIEIINGTLVCRLTNQNMVTIADWLNTEDEIPATIKIIGHVINVDFPENVPVHKMESLLEHFEYQSQNTLNKYP